MNGNEYKVFRNIVGPGGLDFIGGGLISKRYDEPTYMTFRVIFGAASSRVSGTNLVNTDYDKMPHPLFINRVADATTTTGKGRNVYEFNRDIYSTRDYLRDSNEFTRAEMLKEFISLWENLQNDFQWYFQSVEGLNDILAIVPERGKRVAQDARLTFNMVESLDHRISYLLNLYRKIAWDDLYQRWVLPDLMRFFDIQIYVTEFRTFHKSSVTPNSGEPVYLDILNKILPTYLIECQMCEFDLNSFDFSYRNKLSVIDNPEMSTVSFKVKVGNVNEITTYPLFNHFIFNDYNLNGQNRSKEMGSMKDLSGRMTNSTVTNGDTQKLVDKEYASTKDGDARYSSLDQVAQNTFFDQGHVSGTPYLQFTNKKTLFGATGGDEEVTVNPLEPATWVGNAVTFGKAFAVNFVTQKIDKLKMTNIPRLGFSFNEAVAAIESKSFVSVLALIRKAISESISGTQPPSGMLDQQIDTTFREFLTGVSMSEATDGDELELKNTATMVLSNRGKWDEVKDLSFATNLKGPGENNILVEIENRNAYKQQTDILTNNDRSKATDLDGSPNFVKPKDLFGINSVSQATIRHNLEGKKYVNIRDRSGATDLDGGPKFFQPGKIIEAAPSSATSGKKLDTNKIQSTKSLSQSTSTKNIKGGNINGDGGLGNKITDNLESTDIKSEATNNQRIDDKLEQPKPGKATNNPIS